MKSIGLFISLVFACAVGTTVALAQTQQGGTPQPSDSTTTAGNNSSTSPASSMEQMGVGNYLLGPGDVLSLRVFRYQQFDGDVEVDSTGAIEIPLVDQPIIARCRRAQDVQREIAEALKKYIRNPQVSLRVKERRSRPNAVVAGAVRSPQQFQMLRRVKLLQLLAFTGGITEQASGAIQVFHTEAEMCPDPNEPSLPVQQIVETTSDALQAPFTLYNINDLRLGKEEANPYIRPGDVVFVQDAPPVYITGAVIAPQGIYLRNNATLMRAIAQVGGLRKEANQEKILIYRQKPGASEPELITVNYAAIRKNKAPDIVLQPYDVIYVREAGVLSPGRLVDTLVSMSVGGLGSAVTNLPLRVIY
ncbi:MAG: polysaccharide biosynthesis/export family protein [Pyrinomonadaceae bacterium]